MQIPESSGRTAALPKILQKYPPHVHSPHILGATPSIAEMMHGSCRQADAATMAERAYFQDVRAMNSSSSAADLNLFADLVHSLQHALMMTSPNSCETAGHSLLRGPPGLTLSAFQPERLSA